MAESMDSAESETGRAQVLIRCHLCSNKVELFCVSCQINLCRVCAGEHALSSSKRHEILKYTNRDLHIPLVHCSVHFDQNNQCQFYCHDCSLPVCVKCLKFNHKHHNFDDFEHVYNSKKEIILQETKVLKEDVAPNYLRIIDEINEKMAEINTENQDTKEEISLRLQEWNHFVDIAIQILHAKVDMNKEKDLNALQKILSGCKDGLKSVNRAILENEENLKLTVPNERFFGYISKVEEFQYVPTNLLLTNQKFTPGGQETENKQCARKSHLNNGLVASLVPPKPEEGFAFVRRMLKEGIEEKEKINVSERRSAARRRLGSSVDLVETIRNLFGYTMRSTAEAEPSEESVRFIKSQSVKAVIKDKRKIPNLDPYELNKIHEMGEQQDFKLSVKQKKGAIALEGLTEQVINVKCKIHELLRNFPKQKLEEARLIADRVQWSVMIQDQTSGIDKLEPYPIIENMYLEKAYKKKESTITLTMEEGKVMVDLTIMKEYPANNPNSPDKLNVIRKELITGNKIELPPHWAPMKDNENIKVVTLLPSSIEYLDIEKRFLSGVKTGIYNTGNAPNPLNNPVGQFNNVKVNKIERIQNPSLYQQYADKLDQIEKHVDHNKVNLVQDLWHGAAPAAIVNINYYGFNRSYCGENLGDPWYGQGVYFTSDASNSARDCLSGRDPSGRKKVYQARVITGHYCAGKKGMRYLPERMTGVNFDCAVNDLNNPTEFVIFDNTQAYPEYCIEFTI